MKRASLLLAITTILLAGMAPLPVPAGGNIEELNTTQTNIINASWDARTLPIRFKINRNDAAGLTSGVLFGPVTAAFAQWEDLPDNFLDFTYGGFTAVNTAAADGDNVLIFDPPSDPGNFVAAAPCITITEEQTVIDASSAPPDDGLGFLFAGATPVILVPIGEYPRGTNLDCDILFDVFSNTFTTDGTSTTQDVRNVTTHEIGHWLSLSHTFLPDASLFPAVDTNLPGDGIGPGVLHPDDISSVGHIYKDAAFDSNYGTITGIVTLDGVRGDGVHVTALDADTLAAVAGRFSISRFFDPADAIDADDFLTNGTGFYRLDGLPPGDYLVYAEWLDSTDEPFGRLDARHNLTTGNSNVADGTPGNYQGALGFRPERFEFHNTLESGDGGDGSTAGAAGDNPDEGTRFTVNAGDVIPGVDIAINLDPDGGKGATARQNPTGIDRHDLVPFTNLAGGIGLTQDGTDDDFWILHFPAADLPTPPYNVLEGIWSKNGRSDAPYTGGLLLADPADPNLIQPFIVYDGPRLVAGGPDGNTGTTELVDVRDRFNVTINDSRDLYFVVKQPESAGTLIAEGYYIIASISDLTCSVTGAPCTLNPDTCGPPAGNECTGGTGNTFFTSDGFATFNGFVGDVVDILYRTRTEAAPPVMITGATPASLEQATTGSVITISGAGFRAGAEVEFFRPTFAYPAPPEINITGTTFVNDTTLEVTVDVAPNAVPDVRDVLVRNPEAVIPNRSRIFSVTAGLDTDVDGWADAGDCAPGDNTLWTIPSGVEETVLATVPVAGSVRFDWGLPTEPGGVAPVFNVVRGDAATLNSSAGADYGTCQFPGLGGPDVTDSATPAPGQIFVYMINAGNSCGASSYTTPAGNPLRDSNPGNC